MQSVKICGGLQGPRFQQHRKKKVRYGDGKEYVKQELLLLLKQPFYLTASTKSPPLQQLAEGYPESSASSHLNSLPFLLALKQAFFFFQKYIPLYATQSKHRPLQYLAVILTQNSITKNSLFVASRQWECEKAIDESERTGKFHILNFFILYKL